MHPVDLAQFPPRAPAAPLRTDGDRRTGGSTVPASAEIRVGENGRIHGVDGMLDQIAGALVKHARPVLVQDLLPVVQRDTAMQTRIGQAMGQSAAQELKPWIILGAGALAIVAVVELARWHGQKTKGKHR